MVMVLNVQIPKFLFVHLRAAQQYIKDDKESHEVLFTASCESRTQRYTLTLN